MGKVGSEIHMIPNNGRESTVIIIHPLVMPNQSQCNTPKSQKCRIEESINFAGIDLQTKELGEKLYWSE